MFSSRSSSQCSQSPPRKSFSSYPVYSRSFLSTKVRWLSSLASETRKSASSRRTSLTLLSADVVTKWPEGSRETSSSVFHSSACAPLSNLTLPDLTRRVPVPLSQLRRLSLKRLRGHFSLAPCKSKRFKRVARISAHSESR